MGGGYFDEFGIIRDVMQNHLLQVLTLLTMERPTSFNSEDIRDEKVRVLRHMPAIEPKDVTSGIFKDIPRNELVMRIQPNESVYIKMNSKLPGLSMQTVVTELDLTYRRRFSDLKIPEAYESLVLDCLKGDHSNFVRDDELDASWRVFTPLLHYLDENKEIIPMEYPYGSRGPAVLDDFTASYGYKFSDATGYQWPTAAAPQPNKF